MGSDIDKCCFCMYLEPFEYHTIRIVPWMPAGGWTVGESWVSYTLWVAW
jgi:hypothetical protein|eukprot:COSAG02_NODE_2275_length_9246_cov_50.124194_3_plen_49_part_00